MVKPYITLEKYILQYLDKSYNEIKSVSSLLKIYFKAMSIEFVCVLIKNNNFYHLLNILHNSISSPTIIYSHTNIPHDVTIINSQTNEYKIHGKNFTINNMAIIPLFVNKVKIGVLIFGNKKEDNKPEYINIQKKDISRLQPLITLTKIIVNNIDSNNFNNDNKSKMKDFFMANMSHEIRTPLNGIIGYNQLLNRTELKPLQKNYLLAMNQCCSQLLQIVNDVLDYTKLISDNMNLNEECIVIKEIVDSIYNIINIKLVEKHQKFIYDIADDISTFIITDKNKLIQILVNLITNAIKFSTNNSTIELTIQSADNYIIFNVIDNGIGISKKDQEMLFNVFSQVNNNINNQGNSNIGTGLGLAISKKLVELMGGTIWVNSELGKGSTFSFTIQYKEQKDAEKFIQRSIHLLEEKYVLVVDDNTNNRLIITEYLFDWNMKPISCGSGIEALRYIQSKKYVFEICLIDILMPDMTGTELAILIKEEKPYIPIIALSSSDSIIDMSCFDIRLNKPINKLIMFNNILKLLNNKVVNTVMLDKFISKNEELKDEDKLITAHCSGESITNIECEIVTKVNRESEVNKESEGKEINRENKEKNENKSPREVKKNGIKILIAEDVEFNRVLLVTMLESLEFNNVVTSINGRDCIEKLDNNKYDILLLDIKMPEIDGYGVIEYIRKNNINIEIVAVTASVLDDEREQCASYNVKYFIPKPIDIKILREVLCHIVKSFES